MKKHFNGERILLEMPALLSWLESFGFKALSSRYSRYVQYIDDFFEQDNPDSDAGRERFDKLTKANYEILMIVIIKRVFENEKSVGFRERLAKVLTGTDYLNNPPIGESRDYLFELFVAAHFALCKYQIDFNKLTDVVACKDDYLVYSECKRLSSEKRFEDNFRKAGKQLEREFEKLQEKHYGLIFIDISSSISDDLPTTEVNDYKEARLALKQAVDNFIQRNKRYIDSLNERFSSSLAVCLTAYALIWTEDITLYTVMDTRAIAKKTLDDASFEKLNKILYGFDTVFSDLF